LLFDSFDPRSISERDEDFWWYRYCDDVPAFNSKGPKSINYAVLSQSSRELFIRQFESEKFLQLALQEDSKITYAILGIISCEWASVIDRFELILREEPTVISSTKDFGDFQLDTITRQTKYLRENREMLKGCLALINASKKADSVHDVCSTTAARAYDLVIDFEDFILRTEDHIVRVGRGLAVFASIAAIEENRKAIRQAEDIRYFRNLIVNAEGDTYNLLEH
jgi:hypothetical protein